MTTTTATPITDRIAAGMAASGADDHFAPGAGYRRGGFDEAAWLSEVNARIISGYQVRRLGDRHAPAMYGLYEAAPGSDGVLVSKRIVPQEMSALVIDEMARMYRLGTRRGAGMEFERLRRVRRDARSGLPPKPRWKTEVEDLDLEPVEAPAIGR
ncbi:hypothetical protein [Methylobacterium radiotolerans]|nr:MULTISPECIES: hypothetical protein [Methylobacterium]